MVPLIQDVVYTKEYYQNLKSFLKEQGVDLKIQSSETCESYWYRLLNYGEPFLLGEDLTEDLFVDFLERLSLRILQVIDSRKVTNTTDSNFWKPDPLYRLGYRILTFRDYSDVEKEWVLKVYNRLNIDVSVFDFIENFKFNQSHLIQILAQDNYNDEILRYNLSEYPALLFKIKEPKPEDITTAFETVLKLQDKNNLYVFIGTDSLGLHRFTFFWICTQLIDKSTVRLSRLVLEEMIGNINVNWNETILKDFTQKFEEMFDSTFWLNLLSSGEDLLRGFSNLSNTLEKTKTLKKFLFDIIQYLYSHKIDVLKNCTDPAVKIQIYIFFDYINEISHSFKKIDKEMLSYMKQEERFRYVEPIIQDIGLDDSINYYTYSIQRCLKNYYPKAQAYIINKLLDDLPNQNAVDQITYIKYLRLMGYQFDFETIRRFQELFSTDEDKKKVLRIML